MPQIDIRENVLRSKGHVLKILLSDKSTNHNILWASDSYLSFGEDYSPSKQIVIEQVTGKNGKLIQPRAIKTKTDQKYRTKDKAEVFTPLNIVREMNSLIEHNLRLPENHTWQDLIKSIWLEVACGEAPFIAGRYNPTANTRKIISPEKRVGFLDIKLQTIGKHTVDEDEWVFHAEIALKSCYGFEWQGDNLLIARENILLTMNDYYVNKFNKNLTVEQLEKFSEIIAWNIFQMDGIKFVIPMSCKYSNKTKRCQLILLSDTSDTSEKRIECEGCQYNKPTKHNGKYVKIMDWEKNKPIKFVTLLETPII